MGKVQVVVVHTSLGAHGAVGQTVGADVAGTWATLFEGDDVDEAEARARQYVKVLYRCYRIARVDMVVLEKRWGGAPSIDVVAVGGRDGPSKTGG
jgi:hypothetical protein